MTHQFITSAFSRLRLTLRRSSVTTLPYLLYCTKLSRLLLLLHLHALSHSLLYSHPLPALFTPPIIHLHNPHPSFHIHIHIPSPHPSPTFPLPSFCSNHPVLQYFHLPLRRILHLRTFQPLHASTLIRRMGSFGHLCPDQSYHLLTLAHFAGIHLPTKHHRLT